MLSVLVYLKLLGNKTPLVFRRRLSMVKERGQGTDSWLLKEYRLSSMAVKCRMLECLKQLLLEELQLTAEKCDNHGAGLE
jgi:hypothetical protein